MPLVRRGFYEAILGVLRLRADGLMTLGPPCGSFVWISSSSHGRREHKPYGFEDKEWVNIGSMSLAHNEVGVVTYMLSNGLLHELLGGSSHLVSG